jgi:hypothetical protein
MQQSAFFSTCPKITPVINWLSETRILYQYKNHSDQLTDANSKRINGKEILKFFISTKIVSNPPKTKKNRKKIGTGINIPDSQHWVTTIQVTKRGILLRKQEHKQKNIVHTLGSLHVADTMATRAGSRNRASLEFILFMSEMVDSSVSNNPSRRSEAIMKMERGLV